MKKPTRCDTWSEHERAKTMWDTEATHIGMITAGAEGMSPKQAMEALKKVRKLIGSRTRPKEVVIEGVFGARRLSLKHNSTMSTSVAITFLKWEAKKSGWKKKLEWVRVYNDGLLVREWSMEHERYTLALD